MWNFLAIFLVTLSLYADADEEVCHSIGFSGSEFKPNLNGIYEFQPGVTHHTRPAWKNTNDKYYIYWWSSWWEWGWELGGYEYYDAEMWADVQSPDQSTVGVNVYGAGAEDIKLFCDENTAALRFTGVCEENIIDDLVVEGLVADFLECESNCISHGDCAGFSFSHEGCFPHSESCLAGLVEKTTGGWYYHLGPISEFLHDKEVHQSSEGEAEWQATADKAVDGGLHPYPLSGSCSVTDAEYGPWWAVDLGGFVKVKKLSVKIRGDCCWDEFVNVAIATRASGSLTEELALLQTEGPNAMDMHVIHEQISSPGAGARLVLDCDQWATYLVIYKTDLTELASLVLCEVEVVIDEDAEIGRYYLSGVRTTPDTAASTCLQEIGGTIVDIKDEFELGLVDKYLNSLTTPPTRVIIDKQLDDGKFEKTLDPTWQWVSQPSVQAYCTAAASFSGLCDPTLTGNAETLQWIPIVPNSATFKVTLRYPYTVHLVAAKMKVNTASSLRLTLDLEDVAEYTVPVSEGEGMEWFHMNVTGGQLASEVTITFLTFYTTMDVGLASFRVYGTEIGWSARRGNCLDGQEMEGSELLGMDDLDPCLTECKLLEGCVGVRIVAQPIPSRILDCHFRTALCLPEDFTDEDNDGPYPAVLWEMDSSASIQASSSVHGCLNAVSTISMETDSATCLARCAEKEGCTGCVWARNHVCALISNPNTCTQNWQFQISFAELPTTYFSMIKKDGERSDYVGCFSTNGVEIMGEQISKYGTLDDCKQFCSQQNKRFIVSIYLTHCYCADMTGLSAVTSATCGSMCFFGPLDTCGSPNTFSSAVYLAEGDFTPSCYVLSNVLVMGMVMELSGCFNWDYVLCERDVSFCQSAPCQNGGTCADTEENHFECICPTGFNGARCEIDENECASSPCDRGSCQNHAGHYVCVCQPGYEGVNCEIEKDECASDPCQNGGTCNDAVNKYTCTCPRGTFGVNCETNINECASSPCKNGGVCEDGVGGFTCECALGYEGAQCEINIDECASSPCENGATCVDEVNRYRCTCVLGYAGTQCETELMECASYPCQNGATCRDLANKYFCECVPGFTGVNCEIEIDECASDPCANGAECVDYINNYDCECLPGFGGQNCDEFIGNPGEWSAWGNWTSCSATCGNAIRYRQRDCMPLFEEIGEGNCDGSDSQSGACVLEPCPPVDGNWGGWRGYGECSVTCGAGTQNATRRCDYPPPSNGGKTCGNETQQFRLQLCQMPPCNARVSYTEWTEWSECSGQCGAGHSSRERIWQISGPANTTATASNASSVLEIPEEMEQYCEPEGCGATVVASCAVCTGSYASSTNAIPNCGSSQACDSPSQFCSVSYSVNGAQLSLEKRCAEKSACDAVAEEGYTETCLRIGGLAKMEDLNMASVPDSLDLQPEELLSLWTRLNATCTLCCAGTNCNSGPLPVHVQLFDARTTVAGSGSGARCLPLGSMRSLGVGVGVYLIMAMLVMVWGGQD